MLRTTHEPGSRLRSGTWLCAALLLVASSASQASSAHFDLHVEGITLDKTHGDGNYLARAQVGHVFHLTAQGMAWPRAQSPQPSKPDSGQWTFDVRLFKAVSSDAAPDSSKIVLSLQALAPGASEIRFEGKIMGYARQFRIQVEVTAPP